MSGFPDWPNPMRSGAMQCAVGATSGMIFRHRYDEVGFPCRKKRDRCVRVSRFPVGHGGTQNTHLGQYNIIRNFHFALLLLLLTLRLCYGCQTGIEPPPRSLRLGRRSITLRGSGVRSRMTQTTSNGRSLSTRADGSETWSLKTVIAALFERADQSAISKATFW